MGISLRLDDYLPAANWVRIEGDSVNAAVSTRLCHANLASRRCELLLKNLANQVLEVLPIHRSKVVALVQSVGHAVRLYKSLVVPPDVDDWGDRRNAVQFRTAYAF